MSGKVAKRIATILVISIIISSLYVSPIVFAVKTPHLSCYSLTLKNGEQKIVHVKGISSKKIKKTSASSANYDLVDAWAETKRMIVVETETGVGEATVNVIVKLKKKIAGKKTYKFTIAVNVVDDNANPAYSSYQPSTMPSLTPTDYPGYSPTPTPHWITPSTSPTSIPTVSPTITSSPTPPQFDIEELKKSILVDKSYLDVGVVRITNTSSSCVYFRMNYQCLDTSGTSIYSDEIIRYVIWPGESVYEPIAYKDFDKIADFSYSYSQISQDVVRDKYDISYRFITEENGNGYETLYVVFTNNSIKSTHRFIPLLLRWKDGKLIQARRFTSLSVGTVLEPNIPLKVEVSSSNSGFNLDDYEVSMDVS